MVLDLRCIRARRFAHARPRAGPRGASNLGISSLVPGIAELNWVLLVCFDGNRYRRPRLRKIPWRHTNRLEEL
eukprot:COSAG02_NODE_14784_length_1236_cov_11.942832_3_plen_72_part_01